MKTNNEIYDINNSKIKKTFNKKKKSYNCIFKFQINKSDCINSIDIIEDKVVFGTIMGDVYLCRVDEKKLIKKNDEIENNESIKSSIYSSSKTDNKENDESNIKLNNSNSNNKYDCIKLSINNNKKKNNINENNDDNDDNVKIFNIKNKNKNINSEIEMKMNMDYNNSDNYSRKNNNNNYNYNENINFTEEDNIEEDDENNNKYEKKLINKNMGKVQSSQKKNNDIEINNPKTDSKIFNEKKEHCKNNETKSKCINFPQVTKLIMRSKENIPCLEFENNDIINISIGDLEVIRLENMSTFNINDDTSTYNYSKIRNYKTENEHITFCENCTCMMKNSCYLIIFTKFANYNSNLEINDIKYENKDLKKYEVFQGTIKMSNYVIPFDFDGDKFLFVDYISKNERIIRVVYTATKKEDFLYIIKNKEYGHICHMKILPNNKIFLCKKNNECEIHLMNNNFDEIQKWIHIGQDVISTYIYIKNNINKHKNYNNNKKLNLSNYSNDKNDEDESNESNENNESNDSNDEEKSIEIKNNFLKLVDNKKNYNPKNRFINTNQTINIGKYKQKKNNDIDKVNTKNIKKKKEKKFVSFYENIINYTEGNSITKSKRKFFINKIHSLNPSFDNSSRRDIILSIENKKPTNYRNSKANNGSKNDLLTSDKKKKISKNSLSSIEIYGKKKSNDIQNKMSKSSQIKTYLVDNEEEQTVINNKENENYAILTLDKNGTLNIFNHKKQKTLFNIYNISNIDNKYKKMEFFSVGFPYYIVVNELYFAITTDHGLFVISKNND